MKYIWIAFVLALSGCTVTQPYVVEYKIAPKTAKKTSNFQMCKTKSLKVAQVFGAPQLMSQSMRYSKGEYEEYSFTESKWSTTPAVAISASIVDSIRNQDIFSSVSSFRSRSRSDLILESNVEEFMQYFSLENNSSFVRVSIDMALIDAKRSKIIKSKKFTRELTAENIDAQAGVNALNIALSEILDESSVWLASVCK